MFGSRACGRGFPDWGAYKSSSYRHASSLDPSSEVCDLGQRDVHKIEVFGLCYGESPNLGICKPKFPAQC